METLLKDIRDGVRMLLKNQTVTAVAVITLALGIGATTAMFTGEDACCPSTQFDLYPISRTKGRLNEH